LIALNSKINSCADHTNNFIRKYSNNVKDVMTHAIKDVSVDCVLTAVKDVMTAVMTCCKGC